MDADDFSNEENNLRLDRERILRNAQVTQRHVNGYIHRNETVPEELQDALGAYRVRLDENAHLLRQLKALRSIDPKKIVGHIGPETLLQPPANRAKFARRAIRPKWRVR
jgi:hypothetical protein